MVQPMAGQATSIKPIAASFMKRLLWLAVFTATAAALLGITDIIFLDFVRGNPHRTQENAIWMIKYHTPITFLIAGVGVMIVFAIPQYLQAVSIALLLKRFGSRGLYGIAMVVPLAAVLSWYCYDYLTPSNFNLGINVQITYQHGLTLSRYLTTLGFQALITLFSLLRWRLQARNNGKAQTVLTLTTFVASVALGALSGYDMAMR
jgi:hypothetical protein